VAESNDGVHGVCVDDGVGECGLMVTRLEWEWGKECVVGGKSVAVIW
jgi:hypothetical protein